MASSTVSSMPFRRRPSLSLKASPESRIMSRSRSGQCTHMTMTRVYSNEFRCSICLKIGPMGWLYRCTQDRELILEDELEQGCVLQNIDNLASTIGISHGPKVGSPAAKTASKLAFLDEVEGEMMKTYSGAQVATILKQRSHVLESLEQYSTELEKEFAACLSSTSIFTHFAPGMKPTALPNPNKPWISTTECQFKICHHCRPPYSERAYLNLNAIANGEIPATAATGFGFHVLGERPVIPVEILRNIGLHTSPPIPPPHRYTPSIPERGTTSQLPPTPNSSPSISTPADTAPAVHSLSVEPSTFGTDVVQAALARANEGKRLRGMIITRRYSDDIDTEEAAAMRAGILNDEELMLAESQGDSIDEELEKELDDEAMVDISPHEIDNQNDSKAHQSSITSGSWKRKLNPSLVSGSNPSRQQQKNSSPPWGKALFGTTDPRLDPAHGLGIFNYRDDTTPLIESTVELSHIHAHSPPRSPESLLLNPWEEEDIADAKLFFPLDANDTRDISTDAVMRGASTSTPERPTAMEVEEAHEGMTFHSTPLEVAGGVAVTEEAVELHVADVITQF